MATVKGLREKVDEVFIQCSNSGGIADFRSMIKVFWKVLDNSVSVVDLAGVWTMAIPARGQSSSADSMDGKVFEEFFRAIAKQKYPSGQDYCDRLLEDLKAAPPATAAGTSTSASKKAMSDSSSFSRCMDKNTMRVLLKFDLPLRRAFSSFSGQAINVGGGLTWDEVKRLSVGMEVEGFAAFAGAHSLIPGSLTLLQCESLAKEVIARFPLLANGPSLSTSLLYPQFQLLLCLVAVERAGVASRAAAAATAASAAAAAQSGHKEKGGFAAKKVVVTSGTSGGSDHDQRPVADLLSELLREMGVDKSSAKYIPASRQQQGEQLGTTADYGNEDADLSRLNLATMGTIIAPSSQRPVDQYTASVSHMRQAMLLRLQHLFDEITDKLGQFQLESGAFGAADFNMTGATNTVPLPPPPTAPTPTSAASAAGGGGRGGKNDKDKEKTGGRSTGKSTDKDKPGTATGTSTKDTVVAPTTPAAATTAPGTAPVTEGAALGQNGPFGLSTRAQLGPAALAKEDPNAAAPLDGKRMTSKPMVIGDALPVPTTCPEMVEQLLQAALAHHNLGSFEEALKFLEAARVQLIEMEERRRVHHSNSTAKINPVVGKGASSRPPSSTLAAAVIEREPEPVVLDLDLDVYITVCKGNVYQSCGDDEQALIQYLDGWDKAAAAGEKGKDWEMVCLNSVGMLAYFNIRYDVALKCFSAVAAHREEIYGADHADTATGWNNEGCCFFCLGRRSEARLRFEKAWQVVCRSLGHRAARSVAVWKNLEKGRRSLAPPSILASMGDSLPRYKDKEGAREGIAFRDDADKLLLGGTFIIRAIPPPEVAGGKKKKGKKGGKKKKK